MRPLTLLLFAVLTLVPTAGIAANPSEMLADPALETRAEDIGLGLRCLVCQNESIEASDADLAHDLRVLVRERVKAGDSDDQVRQFIVDRYGQFVLLQPVFAAHTLLLWLAAPGLVAIGIVVLVVLGRRKRVTGPTALSAEEAAALASLGPAEDSAE